ncbi:hypothetical protein [thiotrophic endosymbiont of Bathymodiolus puteoserpentis (Logatchev)]|uniref:hypothetical protein n=1 Tax=thiotrophic endosymbiont of Bathymodiolus puteoserpentis (Logatchev) TaxID=343240 RepID=UPI0010B11FEE|nr:hypothetical protein [thiotrophic endosymbiont of Bathymodiolus puteoserpentis (Logatchev)]CAC9576875.1 hypothetical protein [uncultured Gammaproteobacteria bacterium]CAC9634909.1 hypothetical protein [uncultured Gammaproteobacteria bacterium]CAC9640388.1 hypothetical protein [uncultured Gammaproteobacteria bacterium]CAC9958329.1 hypothetical protein [uncultured Gammaproteobacteria bacterium]SSC10423.1 hypothetical protein BPUTEOSOX_195 [thiotrophic endosymbiont of Bathymodiolus puteoserpen
MSLINQTELKRQIKSGEFLPCLTTSQMSLKISCERLFKGIVESSGLSKAPNITQRQQQS